MDKLFMVVTTVFLSSVGFGGCSFCKCKIEKPACVKVPVPSKKEIWDLAKEGGWSYSPQKMEANEICEGDEKETFYKEYSNSESYVAKTQVPKTKMTSCISNVLISSKSKLYSLMTDKTAKEELSETDFGKMDKPKVTEDIVQYVTQGKKRSFYYDCMPTDPEMRWDQCKCVLYASYPSGKNGLLKKIKESME